MITFRSSETTAEKPTFVRVVEAKALYIHRFPLQSQRRARQMRFWTQRRVDCCWPCSLLLKGGLKYDVAEAFEGRCHGLVFVDSFCQTPEHVLSTKPLEKKPASEMQSNTGAFIYDASSTNNKRLLVIAMKVVSAENCLTRV